MEQRNDCIDSLRLIASFMVICIHIPDYPFSQWMNSICAAAVPLFFMISGYYLLRENVCRQQITKHIKKIAVCWIASNILYLLWKLLLVLNAHQNVSDFFAEKLSVSSLAKFVILNESPFGYHLWYLGAMLYCLILSKFFISLKSQKVRKIIYWTIPVLLICDLCIGEYSILLFHTTIHNIWVRNFLFAGVPYFLLGNLLYRYRNRLVAFFKNWMLIVSFILFCFTTWLEKWFLESQNALPNRNHFLSTTFLVFTIMVFAIKNADIGKNTLLPKWGLQYSLLIYLIHPIIITVLEVIGRKTGLTAYYNLFSPLLVFGASLIFAIVYIKSCKFIHKKKAG